MSAEAVQKAQWKPAPVILTYDDYLKLPNDGKQYQIISGILHMSPAPTTIHQRISRELLLILQPYVHRHRLGEILPAPCDVILARSDIVQPDLVYVRQDRLGMIREKGIFGPPDLAVEILSPSTQEMDLREKLQLYAIYGVPHYWIVDPTAKTLMEYILQINVYSLCASHTGRFTPQIFPELTLDLSQVWPT